MNSCNNEQASEDDSGRPGKKQADWREDLMASRDLKLQEKDGYIFFLDWFERWRLSGGHLSDRETANLFWRAKVLEKKRQSWQVDQWMEAMHWYLRWQELCEQRGLEGGSVAVRMRAALENVGARRGLGDRTIDSYGSWIVRFGQWSGTAKRAMDPAVGRDFLSYQVREKGVSQSTQKQALCALVFFYKDICGMEEVDLNIKFRKTTPRVPVVLDVEELIALIGKLTSTWTLAAQLQYGSGLRRSEVMSLRIKDVDTKRRTVTVRKGKGDKDRVTVFPEGLVKAFELHKALARQVYDADRANGRPGVFIKGALGRKMSRAGERWEWFWLFPADEESTDKKSGITRRHHLHPGSYGNAISDAASAAGIEKRVTTHALRHSFATHALDGGVNLRALQELLGHHDVKQTEIYTHTSKRFGAAGIESPLDAEMIQRVANGVQERAEENGDLPDNCVEFPGS